MSRVQLEPTQEARDHGLADAFDLMRSKWSGHAGDCDLSEQIAARLLGVAQESERAT
ncbi:MAG: hypothetical protein M3067_08490 [Chloroflexota bacterium]|nr:hypothetical protein [Chloroflexota bacterium]